MYKIRLCNNAVMSGRVDRGSAYRLPYEAKEPPDEKGGNHCSPSASESPAPFWSSSPLSLWT